jgi:hypothetical protein
VASLLANDPHHLGAMDSPVKEKSMTLPTVLLVMFVLNGVPQTFVVNPDPGTTCEELLAKVPEVLPRLIGKDPQAYAAACVQVTLFETKV